MSGFTAAALETLDYDFTAIQSAVQPAPTDEQPNPPVTYCTGKGVVPEPTTTRINQLFDFIAENRQRVVAAAKAVADGEAPEDSSLDHSLDRLRTMLAEFTNGSPTRAQLDELPPRALSAFYRWLAGEFVPKG